MRYSRENPELASFLRKLDSLRTTLSDDTVLILDTTTPPFDLLQNDSLNLIKTDTPSSEE